MSARPPVTPSASNPLNRSIGKILLMSLAAGPMSYPGCQMQKFSAGASSSSTPLPPVVIPPLPQTIHYEYNKSADISGLFIELSALEKSAISDDDDDPIMATSLKNEDVIKLSCCGSNLHVQRNNIQNISY